MSKAYKCNLCGDYFDGSADTQAGHNENLERYLSFILGVKFSPENQEAQFYVKDLCPACAKAYCEVWRLLAARDCRLLGFLKGVMNG